MRVPGWRGRCCLWVKLSCGSGQSLFCANQICADRRRVFSDVRAAELVGRLADSETAAGVPAHEEASTGETMATSAGSGMTACNRPATRTLKRHPAQE
jgi:hypothetical protein